MSAKMIYVISGPSGCGKSTLIRRVLAGLDGVRFSVSHTTRERRRSEVEGKDYYFVSRDRFLRLIAKDAFVEWAVVHGAYYGTSKRSCPGAGSDVIPDSRRPGGRSGQEEGEDGRVFIFVLPPSFRELRKRIKERGLDSAAAIRRRVATARKEVRAYASFDYVVVNDDIGTARLELESILRCRRVSLAARKKSLEPILRTFRGKG
jgi:guanylate kinase